MVTALAGLVVLAFGLSLLGFAGLIAFRPAIAERFLRSFASSAPAHSTEQTGRLIAGMGLVIFSPAMWFADLFEVLGWLIVITAAGLFLVPWRWHHRFGQWAIPLAIRHLRLYALGAFVLGAFILHGASRPVLS
jgi:hypothetical protein